MPAHEWPTLGLPRVKLRPKQPFGLIGLDVSARLPTTSMLIWLEYSYFSPFCTVSTLPILLSALIKVIEAILVLYFPYVSWIMINL